MDYLNKLLYQFIIMRLSEESASLQFDISIIVPINSSVPVAISRDVNMRTLLGHMYNKYNKFCIRLTSVSGFNTSSAMTYSAGNVTGITGVCWFLRMTGLDFVQNGLNTQISQTAIFPMCFGLPINVYTNGINSTFTMNGIVFNKSTNDNTTINLTPIYFGNLQPANAVTTGFNVTYGQTYNFLIYGLLDE